MFNVQCLRFKEEMKDRSRYINGNSGMSAESNSWDYPEYDLRVTPEDSNLFETIGEYLKGRIDLEEVIEDPSFQEIENNVKKMISDYRADSSKHKDNERFIKDNFIKAELERKIPEEIRNIKFEIHKSDLNDLTAEWVKEWHIRKRQEVLGDTKKEEIRNFIASSLGMEEKEPEQKLATAKAKSSGRSLPIRYISLSAAVIAVFFLIRTLLPSSDPAKLFSSFYKPFNVISVVTRGGNANGEYTYSAAVENYRTGNYQTAASGFSVVLQNDPTSMAPRFFLGITQLALGNYEQSIDLLNGIKDISGDYRKEASWYLGLAYLKTGEKEKAIKCFDQLSHSSGYYTERSAEILRRLK
jgi:tetratricopeptide (TPR) repeat protein